MHLYSQSLGTWTDPDGVITHGLYSGAPSGKNNPALSAVHNIGPIPQGKYVINDPPEALNGGPHGPFVLRLTPDPENEMFGRSGFLIHGDTTPPGNASEGCIIAPRVLRNSIAASEDKELKVTL